MHPGKTTDMWMMTGIVLVPLLASCGGGQTQSARSPETAPIAPPETTHGSADSSSQVAEDDATSARAATRIPAEEAEEPAGAGAPRTDEARKKEIWDLIRAQRENVARCYRDAQKKNPQLGTRLTVTFVLNPDGTFKEPPSVSKERSDITDQQVVTCALETIKAIKFPPHPKGMETTFYYPFGF